MSDVSEVVGLGLAHEAEVMLRKGGATREFWIRLSQDEDLAKRVVALVMADSLFHLTVDYGLSLAQMIAAGRYVWVNPDITAKHFPVSGQGKQTVGVGLWHPDKYFKNGDKVIAEDKFIAELKREKPEYRFATLPELLALGAAQPELQRQFPIAALGSIWSKAGGNRDFVCLSWAVWERDLDLNWLGDKFDDRWRFAVVRK